MSDCLVTKLKGVVDDDSLRMMGDMPIRFSKNVGYSSLSQIDIGYQNEFDVKVIGAGNLVTSAGDVIGKTNHYAAWETHQIFVDSDVEEIVVSGGYGLTGIGYAADIRSSTAVVNLKDIKYQKNAAVLNVNSIGSAKIEGDISDTPSGITNFLVFNCRELKGTLKDLSQTGNKFTSIRMVSCGGVSGDLADLANLNSLSFLQVATCGKITGDLSKLPNSLKTLNLYGHSTISWEGTRPPSAYIMSILDAHLGTYLDAALINLAQCTNWEGTGKSMLLYGKRTSASDAAIASLQSMGWTVNVTEE